MKMELETENKEGLGMSFQIISMWRAELVITHENLGIEGAIFWSLRLVIRFVLKSNHAVPKPSHAVVKKLRMCQGLMESLRPTEERDLKMQTGEIKESNIKLEESKVI